MTGGLHPARERQERESGIAGMTPVTGRTAVNRAATVFGALGMFALLVGCEPVNDPSAGMSVADAVALIDQAPGVPPCAASTAGVRHPLFTPQ